MHLRSNPRIRNEDSQMTRLMNVAQRLRSAAQISAKGQMTPSDQIRPLPRHIPIVDSKVYS